MKTIALHLHDPDIAAFTAQARHVARLRAAFPGARVLNCVSEDAFVAALPEVTHAFVWRFDAAWLALAPRLKCIATPAAGHEGVAFEPPPGVTLCFGAFHGPLIAQTVVAQLLACHRGVLAADRFFRAGAAWPRAEVATPMRDVRGTHAVVLGFGHIGQAIGGFLKPFGIRVTGVRRAVGARLPAWFDAADAVVPAAALEAVLPHADHLVCALPATAETTLLLDARRLAMLPAHAVLVNIGRGNVVDEGALAAQLHAGGLGAALLDVFHGEPLPPASPLRSAPNAFLMPHASAIAPNYLDCWLDELIPLTR